MGLLRRAPKTNATLHVSYVSVQTVGQSPIRVSMGLELQVPLVFRRARQSMRAWGSAGPLALSGAPPRRHHRVTVGEGTRVFLRCLQGIEGAQAVHARVPVPQVKRVLLLTPLPLPCSSHGTRCP